MRKTLFVALISGMALSGCAALNPFNWFGSSRPEAVDATAANPLIPRRSGGLFSREEADYAGEPVDRVTGLAIERTPGGAVVRVDAVAASQGSYDVRLVPDADAPEDVRSYRLMALVDPRYARVVGPESGRRITAALFLSTKELEGVREIRVAGARNARVSRR